MLLKQGQQIWLVNKQWAFFEFGHISAYKDSETESNRKIPTPHELLSHTKRITKRVNDFNMRYEMSCCWGAEALLYLSLFIVCSCTLGSWGRRPHHNPGSNEDLSQQPPWKTETWVANGLTAAPRKPILLSCSGRITRGSAKIQSSCSSRLT